MSSTIRKWLAKALVYLALALLVLGVLMICLAPTGTFSLLGITLSWSQWGWVAVGAAALAFTLGYVISSEAASQALAVVTGAVKDVVSAAEDVVTSSSLFWIAIGVGAVWLLSSRDS